MNDTQSCPIWGTTAKVETDNNRDGVWVDSPRTGGGPGDGRYFISRTAQVGLEQLDPPAKARLTTWLIDQRILGTECPEILSTTLREVIQPEKSLSNDRRADRLLQYIANHTEEISKIHNFTSQEMGPLAAWSESVSWHDVKYLLDELCKKNLLEKPDENQENLYRITTEGHTRAEEFTSLLQDVRDEGTAIISTARSTAFGISLEEVQKQFRECQKLLYLKAALWLFVGVCLLAAFICASLNFWETGPPEGEWHQVAYHSAIRISILAMLATAAAFFLKIFRAHLHLIEKNQHRQHVANCVGSFVEAASTPEQRDLILGQLVDSIIQFGSSGLLPREDEQVYPPRMTVDSIIRSLSTNPPRQQ